MHSLVRRYIKTAIGFLALRIGIVLCGLAQTLGLLVFFQTMWTRIRPLGSAAREKAGERF